MQNFIDNTQNEALDKPTTTNDLSLSQIIFITNPNKEIALGVTKPHHPITPEFDSLPNERKVTLQHYGTIEITDPVIPTDFVLRTYTVTEFNELKIHNLLLKYITLLISIFVTAVDIRTIKYRIINVDSIVAELRMIHIQMDDAQLYQIFWSFIIVYCIASIFYIVLAATAAAAEKVDVIRMMFKVVMFTLIYEIVEIVLRQYDIMLVFVRVVLIFLIKVWINVRMEIEVALSLHPEYRTYSVSLFRRRQHNNNNNINASNNNNNVNNSDNRNNTV